jgi:meiotic recombination protein SPO11
MSRDHDDYVPGYLDDEEDSERQPKKSKSSSKPRGNPSLPAPSAAVLQQRIDMTKKKIGDPARVLQKVVALVEHAAANAKRPRKTLSELGIDNVKHEVLDMNSDTVRANVERMIVEIADSILQGQGFSYSVPSRSSGNQLYVPELDRMVLKDKVSDREFASKKNARKAAITTRVLQLVHELSIKKIHVTKRDLFYTDVKLFQKQAETDDILDDVRFLFLCFDYYQCFHHCFCSSWRA